MPVVIPLLANETVGGGSVAEIADVL